MKTCEERYTEKGTLATGFWAVTAEQHGSVLSNGGTGEVKLHLTGSFYVTTIFG